MRLGVCTMVVLKYFVLNRGLSTQDCAIVEMCNASRCT